MNEEYTPEVCPHCGQSTTYLLSIDKGSVDILKQIALFIYKKGQNVVHPRKEMEGTWLTSNQVGNLSRPRFHGLIARYKDEPGNYVLTHKGAQFLKGESVAKFAIISKDKHCQLGYWRPTDFQCNIHDFTDDDEYWEGINYEIKEGRVVLLPPEESKQETLL